MSPNFLDMSVTERRAYFKERQAKLDGLSAEAKAVFETARNWGASVSPELAEAMVKAVIETAKPKP